MLVVERFDFPGDDTRNATFILRHSRDFENARGSHQMDVLRGDTGSNDDVDEAMLVLSS